MSYIFTTIYDFFTTRKVSLYILLGILTILLAAGVFRLRYENDINKMIPQDEKISSLSNYLQHTEGGEKMVLSISGHNGILLEPDSLISLQQLLVTTLDSVAGTHIKSIESEPAGMDEWGLYRLSSDYLPLYLTAEDYTELEARLQPDKIQAYFQKQKELLQTPAGGFISQALPQDPLGLNYMALSKFRALNQNSQYSIIDNHIFTADERKLIFFLTPRYANSDNKRNQALQQAMQSATTAFHALHPQCDVQYFSGGLIGADNASQMQKDTILTLSITLVLLIALTWYIFKRKRTGLLLMLPVIFGMLFSLGLLSLFKGTLAIMALGVGAVILGIALDFSIHYLNHAREKTTSREDVQALALPLSLGAFTTIGAFFILNFAQASVLRDVGLFASLALTGASLFTLVFLPHIVDHLRLKQVNTVHQPTFIDKWARWQPEKNKYLVIGIFILTPVFWYFSGAVQFDGDLMKLNYMSDAMRRAETSFNQDAQQSLRVIYAISKDRNADKALERSGTLTAPIELLQHQGLIQQFVQPSVFIKSATERKEAQQRWQEFWTREKTEKVQQWISGAAAHTGMDASALIPLQDFIHQKQFSYSEDDLAELKGLMPMNISNYLDTIAYITTIKVTNDHRKAVLAALDQYPGLIITDRQSIAETLISYIKDDFNNLVFYSGALVFLALLIVYGRIELALMSFLPMAISWVWILGIMGIFHIEFNIVNIIICTLIFGLGDDYCIFMMDGLIEKYKNGHNKILISRSAIYVSALTTIIGLGVLIFAQHPALKSIALIAVLGIACVVMISQVLQPFLFNLFIQKRADKGLMPFTLWSFSKMIFAFTYFVIGCLILTFAGLVLVYLNPWGRSKGKRIIHTLISAYIRSLIYIMSNVKKSYHYSDKAYHKTPAIYIANHTSFLDILIMTGLHPKVILITADWVWKSPVMGPLVRMADYYPATEGAEEGLHHLRKMRDRGYSIVIFPEGTRSYTDKMGKFRKGAFYLAEQLEMDIQPLVLHGIQYTMEKGDFLLKNGHIRVHVEERIAWNDPAFGATIADRRKKVSQWFRQQYSAYKVQYETPSYFRETLIKSHLYKGPVLEWYCRIKTRLENNYEQFHALLPREGKYYDLGCGYGFMTFMLHWAAPGRQFTGIDYDEEKISTAQRNYYFNTRRYRDLYNTAGAEGEFSTGLSFCHGDLTNIQLQPCNGILLMDALHYLLPEQQDALLRTCYEALLPGGVLILRDGVKEDRKKHETTKLTEIFSTRILRFNKTSNNLHFISKTHITDFFELRGANVTTHNYSRNLSNHTFIITKPLPEGNKNTP